ncbi:MAG: sulfotransferase [Acidimicrobiales bacterium]|nr:sulfotransferase [Acidimicrobiales bacterium]
MVTPMRIDGISFLVCATQRSGSTLFCELLRATGVAGVPDEYFERLRATGLPRQPRQYFEDDGVQDIAERLAPTVSGRPEEPGEFEAWFRYVLQRATTSNGVFGAKMMWNYLDDFKVRMAELPGLGGLTFNAQLDVVFPRLKIIFIRRRDKVAQAVSLWKAIQTQRWRTESESDSDDLDADTDQTANVEYDYRAIEHLLDQLHRWDARWEDWFHATGREPIRIFYDEFTVNRAATIGRVLDILGIDPPEPEGKGSMKRQADDLSKDWVSRFRAESEQRQRV